VGREKDGADYFVVGGLRCPGHAGVETFFALVEVLGFSFGEEGVDLILG
jgi:hypothetical protein